MRKDREKRFVTAALIVCAGLIALLVLAIVVVLAIYAATSIAARRPPRSGTAHTLPRRPVEGHFALQKVVDSRPT